MKIPSIGEPIVLPDGTRGTLHTKRGDPATGRLWLGVMTEARRWCSVAVEMDGPDMRVKVDEVDLQAADLIAARVIAGIDAPMPVTTMLLLLAHATLARREAPL
jgi:hypothetical protein